MFKAIVALCLVAVFVDAAPQVTLESGLEEVNTKVALKSLPPDDGRRNWGDLVYRERQQGDKLLLRETVLIPTISNVERPLKYFANVVGNTRVSSVRLINLGRERAFGTDVENTGRQVNVYFTVPARSDPRILIEIYGFTN